MEEPRRLFNRNFFLLWQGQFVSQLGNQAYAIALMFWLKHTTESAGVMGLIMMLSMLPGVILGPIGGTVADRYSRKRIIVLCDLFSGLVVISLAVMIFAAPNAQDLIVVWLAVAAVILGTLSAVFRPAVSASIPDLVPKDKITAANSFNQSSFQISALIGQASGGILYRLLGAPFLFLIDGISYILSAFSESFITIPQEIPERTKGPREAVRAFFRDTAEGFTYIWKRVGMRHLFFAATILNFFMSPFIVLLPFYIEDHLHATPDWFGYFLAVIGAGAMAGYVFAGAIKAVGRARMIIVISMLFLNALTFAVLGIISTAWAALVIGLVIGFLNGIVNINIITILQLTTPGEIRGRVFGLLGTIAGGLMPVGMGLAGVIADLAHQNIPAIFIVCGLLVAASTLVVAVSRDFRDFLSYRPEAQRTE